MQGDIWSQTANKSSYMSSVVMWKDKFLSIVVEPKCVKKMHDKIPI